MCTGVRCGRVGSSRVRRKGCSFGSTESIRGRALSGQAVVADSLTKRFGSVLAVDSLSFGLAPGTITGFLGPNGAGKTTTLRMLLGLMKPSGGTARIFDCSYAELQEPALRVGAVLEVDGFPSGPFRA